jgi:hypothetical protein
MSLVVAPLPSRSHGSHALAHIKPCQLSLLASASYLFTDQNLNRLVASAILAAGLTRLVVTLALDWLDWLDWLNPSTVYNGPWPHLLRVERLHNRHSLDVR